MELEPTTLRDARGWGEPQFEQEQLDEVAVVIEPTVEHEPAPVTEIATARRRGRSPILTPGIFVGGHAGLVYDPGRRR